MTEHYPVQQGEQQYVRGLRAGHQGFRLWGLSSKVRSGQ